MVLLDIREGPCGVGVLVNEVSLAARAVMLDLKLIGFSKD